MIEESLNDFNELDSLHRFSGSPRDFWQAFLQLAVKLEDATGGEVLIRVKGEGKEPWRRVALISGGMSSPIPESLAQPLAERCFQEGMAASTGKDGAASAAFLALPLKTDDDTRDAALLLVFQGKEPDGLLREATRLLMLADSPALYRRNRLLQQTQADITSFASTLDLLTVLHGQARFGSACMALCNELASRFQASQVAIGWVTGKYVKIRAVSNLDEVIRKMDAVQRLEAAMEESLDQDDEIVLPASPESSLVARDNEIYARQEQAGALATIPLRVKDSPVAALTLLREKEPFEEREVRALRVAADQVAPLLEHIRRRDRWFGARWIEGGRTVLGKIWGVDHAWTKLAGILVCALLAVLIFGKMTHRIEAPFIVRTEMQAYLSAPFDGYISRVHFETGDAVSAGTVLLQLDDAELRVQEASLLADIRRYQSEAERARGMNDFAQMRVSRAQEDQARADLALGRLHLAGADVHAPFDALIVEDGQLRQRLGASVQRGETLLKLARSDLLYVEMQVKERDIDDLVMSAPGRIAFASRPNLKFPISISKIEPTAVSEEGGGVFLARGRFEADSVEWWRPGMTGVAKVDVEKRPIIWILTHRLIDFIRLKFWI
ncbi:MAG: efflux RND transporter periplasmic adaptor subunit [Opitutales bacterium]